MEKNNPKEYIAKNGRPCDVFDDEGTIPVEFQRPRSKTSNAAIDDEEPDLEQSSFEESAKDEMAMEKLILMLNPNSSEWDNNMSLNSAATQKQSDDSPSRDDLEQRLLVMAKENRLLLQQVEEATSENRLLRQQVEETTNENCLLRNDIQLLRRQAEKTNGPTLKAQIIETILAAFGWNAPIVFEDDDAVEWRGKSKKSLIRQIVTCPRKVFFVSIALVDFLDAVLDFIISWRGILQEEDGGSRIIRRWAMVLFSITIASRFLAGVFRVFYYQIDRSNRLMSYFLVEMTIFCMEDMAACVYLIMKYADNGVGSFSEWDSLDVASLFLSFICGIAFVVPTLYRSKNITDGLSPLASQILLAWFILLVFAFCLVPVFLILTYGSEKGGYGYMQSVLSPIYFIESLLRLLYPGCVVGQLCCLCLWCHSLYRKNTPQPRDLEEGEELSS